AAREFDDLFDRYPRSDAAIAARYWAGRAWATAGDSAIARERWADTRRRFPYTYYATRSGLRLGVPLEIPADDTSLVVPDEDVNETMARIALLESLGMEDEAQIETSGLIQRVGQSTPDLLAAAAAFRDNGEAHQSLRLASRALGRGAPTDTATYRLLFPVLEEGGLRSLAQAHDVEPALVAGLIRQESSFNPRALSPAGARGLMQIMPPLGEKMAETLNYPVWDPVLLYQPSVSLQMGIEHLSGLVRDYEGNLPRVLAAYNAGKSRVERWKERQGADDPELFTERIPYRETRDYVRLVLRNMEIYEALYDWEQGEGSREKSSH
ncbi:MAG: transglycosylase SLT domain-containing protein, partial [Gemmatimonadales bacterium]